MKAQRVRYNFFYLLPILGLMLIWAISYLNFKPKILLSDLPTIEKLKENLKHNPNSAEEHSELLIAAAEPIAFMYEYGKQNKDHEALTFTYFKDCAESKEIITPVRAVCYKKYLALLHHTKNTNFIKLPNIDAKVEKLVGRM